MEWRHYDLKLISPFTFTNVFKSIPSPPSPLCLPAYNILEVTACWQYWLNFTSLKPTARTHPCFTFPTISFRCHCFSRLSPFHVQLLYLIPPFLYSCEYLVFKSVFSPIIYISSHYTLKILSAASHPLEILSPPLLLESRLIVPFTV